MSIADLRVVYDKDVLLESALARDPLAQFAAWFEAALSSDEHEPNAMTLATADTYGQPSARIVLLKGMDARGLVFFTNYQSRKGQELAANPRASLLFFWPERQRQVRIEGRAERLPAADSDEYFASRPKASRIGAIASPQSQVIENRSVLEAKVDELTAVFSGTEWVPRPDFWGGYLVRPVRMEFWQGRSNRLHDRIEYILENNRWTKSRLAP